MIIKIENGAMTILKHSLVSFKEAKENGLHLLQRFTLDARGKASVVKYLDNVMLWHMRLGHVNKKGLCELTKQSMLGSEPLGNLKFCEQRIFGKNTKVKFYQDHHTNMHALDYVHFDLWGPTIT